MSNPAWTIILAAGAGRRLAAVTCGIPKQFWAPPGRATLLENTVDRVQALTPLARTVTVIDRLHGEFASGIARRRPLGQVAVQPMDRGTAAGVLLGLATTGPDPNAVVLLTPSDHGIENPAVFHRGIRTASRAVKSGRSDIVLFGVQPRSPAGDFGWIVPAPAAGTDNGLQHVGAFVEKPADDLAGDLYRAGAAWNTMVMVARAGALLDLYQQHLPTLAEVFRTATAMPARPRASFLAERYPDLSHRDFSRDLITPARGLRLHVWPTSLGWTDLGTPERLLEWLSAQRATGRRRPAARGVRASAAAVA